jgi:three-Cys-motif partner protein
MPARRTEWIEGPDKLDARVVGPWVRRKVHHVDRLLDIFGTAMKNKWPHRGYVELFAGPGMSYDRGHHEFLEGSARRAMGRNFTHFAFVDRDSRATLALAARLESDGFTPDGPLERGGLVLDGIPGPVGPSKKYRILRADCNDAIPSLRTFIPANALSLVFVDPTAFQIRMESVLRLVAGRYTDILVTFHVGAMIRVGMAGVKAPAVDAFFGTRDWRAAVAEPRERRTRALIDCYNEQLTNAAHYLPGAFETAVSVRNSKGVTMYLLVLFTRHPLGRKFWREAAAVDELGQRSLWEVASD